MKKHCLLAAGCLVLLLVSPRPAAAVDESKPCIPEPTDQVIAFGDVLSGETCQISPAGDVDTFRFTASPSDFVSVVATDLSGNVSLDVCLQLLGPNDPPVNPITCGNASIQMDRLLAMGVYTIRVSERGNDATFSYTLSLERLVPVRPEGPFLEVGPTLSEEIRPAGDIDAYRVNGRAGGIMRLAVADLSGDGSLSVCLEFFNPDGLPLFTKTCAGNASFQRDVALTTTGIYTLVVSERGHAAALPYTLTLTCLSGDCAQDVAICEVALSSIGGTLDIDFTLLTARAATWNVWLSVMNTAPRLWSVGPFVIDSPVSAPFSVPNFPALGTIGFLTTLTTPDSPHSGIICSDWETVDTGEPTPGAAAPTAEQLRRLFPSRRP